MSNKETINANGLVDIAIFSSAEDLGDLLDELNTKLPRTLRIKAMQETLNPYFTHELNTFEKRRNLLESNETKRLEYLKSTTVFTEMQLRESLSYYHDQNLLQTYYRLLWGNILKHLEKNGATTDYLKAFFTDKMRDKQSDDLPHHDTFNTTTDQWFYDKAGMIDGLTFDQLRTTLYNSATKNLVIATGKKYGLDIHKTMNKQQMRTLMKTFLEQRNQLDSTLRTTIENGSIKELEDIAASYELPIRSYLTKEDMIEQLIIHVSYNQELTTKKEEKETTETTIKRLETEISELKKLINSTIDSQKAHIAQDDTQNNDKKRMPVLDVVAAMMIGFLFIGLMSYFLNNVGMFATINNLVNQVTYREQGLMDLYHNVIDFIIRG